MVESTWSIQQQYTNEINSHIADEGGEPLSERGSLCATLASPGFQERPRLLNVGVGWCQWRRDILYFWMSQRQQEKKMTAAVVAVVVRVQPGPEEEDGMRPPCLFWCTYPLTTHKKEHAAVC